MSKATAVLVATEKSQTQQIFEIRSYDRVRSKWEPLSNDQKRKVLAELDGDFSESWALQVIKDIASEEEDASNTD